MSKRKRNQHKIYDNALRTVEAECSDALISFVNYVFHESYDNTAKVVLLRNEHYFEKNGDYEKLVTDTHFKIIFNGKEKEYQFECESGGYSESIMVRLFQYSIMPAIDENDHEHDRIIIRIPHVGLLVLRDKGNPPKVVTIEIATAGGNVSYEVPVICEADYTIDELFSNKLYFLLPFYGFNLEKNFSEYESDKEKMKEFENDFNDIISRLEYTDEADLSLRSKGVIIKEMEKVTRKLTIRYSNLNRKVGDIMGGNVDKLEWLERFDNAVSKGRSEGKVEGMVEEREVGIEIFVRDKFEDAIPPEVIVAKLKRNYKLSDKVAKEYVEKYAPVIS